MTTGLQNYEKATLQKIDTWTARHKSDVENNRSTTWSEKQVTTAEEQLKKVRPHLEKAAIEKELIAAEEKAARRPTL